MSVYRQMVENRRAASDARSRGLSARSLSRLTRTVDDERAWDEAYRAALWIGARRDAHKINGSRDRRAARYSVRVDRMSA